MGEGAWSGSKGKVTCALSWEVGLVDACLSTGGVVESGHMLPCICTHIHNGSITYADAQIYTYHGVF